MFLLGTLGIFQLLTSMNESSSWYLTCSSLTTSGISGILVDLELTDELDLNNLFILTSFCLSGLNLSCFDPSTARNLSTALYLCEDSLLGLIEATMYDGPVYFDCYPDFTISLSNSHILKVLTLSIRTQGYRILEGVQGSIISAVC